MVCADGQASSRAAGAAVGPRRGQSSTLSPQTQQQQPRETQPAALSGAIRRREAEEDRARASQRLGLEHWTRRLVGGHSAQCLSAMTPMAMPRNNKKNAGIQFGSNGTTYLRPVPFPAQNGIKFKLRLAPIFGRSAAAQQNMPRYRLMGSHQRFSVLAAKYGGDH